MTEEDFRVMTGFMLAAVRGLAGGAAGQGAVPPLRSKVAVIQFSNDIRVEQVGWGGQGLRWVCVESGWLAGSRCHPACCLQLLPGGCLPPPSPATDQRRRLVCRCRAPWMWMWARLRR